MLESLKTNSSHIFLTFMGPCIVIIFYYISNKMQRYTFYFIWKLLYMFRVVPPPVIRSANNCIYSTVRPFLVLAAITAGRSNGLTYQML
jgi:hypothetical protein